MRLLRRGLLALLILAAAINASAFLHAWRFTHFAPAGERTPAPEDLSALQRAGVLLTGARVPRPALTAAPADLGLAATERQIDGIAAWILPGGEDTALLFHGYGGTRSDLLAEGALLQSQGYTAVLGVQADALALESPFDRLLTTVGHRFAAMGLPAFPGAHPLVLWGGLQRGFDAFSHDPVAYARGVRAPTLLLHGAADPRVRLAEVEAVRAALAGPSAVEVFPGAGHERLRSADPARWERAVRALIESRSPS